MITGRNRRAQPGVATGASAHQAGDEWASAGAATRLWHFVAEIGLLAVLAAVYLGFALAVRGSHSFSGDEPHYLAFTQSLWLYHTIDQHNVLYNHDFFVYFDHIMSSHSVHRGEHLYPLHYAGLPVLLLPGFALAGAAGTQVTLVLIAVAVCWRSYRLCVRVAGTGAALVAVGTLGLSAPFILSAGAVYPDFLSGLLIILAFEMLLWPGLTRRRAIALGVVLALCPWVHVKLLLVVALYLLWASHRLWRQARAVPSSAGHWNGRARVRAAAVDLGAPVSPRAGLNGWALRPGSRDAWPAAGVRAGAHVGAVPSTGALAAWTFGLPLVSLAALMVYNAIYYGSPSPAAPYSGATLFTGNPLGGAIGQLLAQGQGALGTAPIFLLVMPGAIVLWRCNRALATAIAYVTLPFWLATLTYRDWWGGDAPPLRYLLPVLPLWAAALAALVASLRTWMARVAVAAMASITLVLSAMILVAPRLGWPLPHGSGALVLALGDHLQLPLTTWLPAFEPLREGPGIWHQPLLAALWAAALSAVWLGLALWEQRVAPEATLYYRQRRASPS